jgi:NitT/TauT family transport system permease protein
MSATASPVLPSKTTRSAFGWVAWFLDRYTTLISLAVFLLIWEGAVRFYHINDILLPAPSAIFSEFFIVWKKGLLWMPFFDSLKALAIGLLWSIGFGVPAGIILGASKVLDLISAPYFWAFRATPRVAIAPLLVIWVGYGYEAKVWMVFLSAGILIMLVVQEAVITVDQSLVGVARSFGASKRNIYFKVIFPYILPAIANAIRNGVGTGIVGLLVVEMFSASGGLGAQVIRASYTYNSARMFALIALLLALSLGLINISRRLEKAVSRWREEAYT